MANHRLDAAPETVHWGFFDAALKPLLTVDSGETVTISTVSGMASQMPPSPYVVPSAARDPRQCAAKLPGHMCTGRSPCRAPKRAGAGSPHQGHPASLRLGLQHDPAARRRAADDFDTPTLIHIPLDKQKNSAKLPWGSSCARPVLRRDGGGAAACLGMISTLPPRRNGGNLDNRNWSPHHALSADPCRRRAVLGRRRPRRAGRWRGLHHGDRDRVDRTFELHVRPDMALDGRSPRPRRTMITMAFDPDLDDCV